MLGKLGMRVPLDLPARLRPCDEALPVLWEGLRPAAVLAVVAPDGTADNDDALVLIERAPGLPSHAGQLAFPGGKPEPHDASLLATALREAEEEIGLDRTAVEVVGRLHAVPTPSGFLIAPFVAIAHAPLTLKPHAGEVARILTPRLRDLTATGVYRSRGRGSWRGYDYEMHEYAIHDPPLWGATAGIVRDLLQRLP